MRHAFQFNVQQPLDDVLHCFNLETGAILMMNDEIKKKLAELRETIAHFKKFNEDFKSRLERSKKTDAKIAKRKRRLYDDT